MSYLTSDSISWYTIQKADEWLDDAVGQVYKDQPLAQDWARVSKIVEETGEAIDNLIQWTGQNPRKPDGPGFREDMLKELADVAVTAILAIQHFTKDSTVSRFVLEGAQEKLQSRIPPHRRAMT